MNTPYRNYIPLRVPPVYALGVPGKNTGGTNNANEGAQELERERAQIDRGLKALLIDKRVDITPPHGLPQGPA